MEKKNIPELRFKGFEDEYIKLKFEDIAKVSQGLQIAIEKRYLKPDNTMLFYITNEFLKKESKIKYYIKDAPNNVIAEKDDILMTRTGNTGKVITDVHGAFHNNFFKIDYDRKSTNKYYLFYLLNSPSYQKIILSKAGSSTIPDLNHKDFLSMSLKLPCINEQIKVEKLLNNIDKKLKLEKEKHRKLKDFKKSMLEDMFPKEGESIPKLRFDGFDGQWSTYELSELGHKYTSLTGKTKKDFGHGSARYITFINVLENPISKIDGVEKIEIDNNQTSVKKGDIFFNISSETYDEVGLSSVWTYDMDNYYLNSFCTGFRPNVNLDSYFISYLLRSETLRKQITKLAQGISRINISQTKLLNIKLLIPEYQEQEKIGNFFKNLDQKIEASEEKIKKIEDFKKSLMEKMFV